MTATDGRPPLEYARPRHKSGDWRFTLLLAFMLVCFVLPVILILFKALLDWLF